MVTKSVVTPVGHETCQKMHNTQDETTRQKTIISDLVSRSNSVKLTMTIQY